MVNFMLSSVVIGSFIMLVMLLVCLFCEHMEAPKKFIENVEATVIDKKYESQPTPIICGKMLITQMVNHYYIVCRTDSYGDVVIDNIELYNNCVIGATINLAVSESGSGDIVIQPAGQDNEK